ncbi:MAG: hypothetical protein HN350_13445 [Phycisphaerales bacterium]|jgi:hypothetical protein|nr:hypothetical protein [Phycisphaerales bacterium]
MSNISELVAPFESIIIDNSKSVSLHPWARRERTEHKWNGEALLWDAPRYAKPVDRVFGRFVEDGLAVYQHDARRSFRSSDLREVRTDAVFGKLGIGYYFEAIDGIAKRLCDVFSFFSSGIE